jgi:hypothetical protein
MIKSTIVDWANDKDISTIQSRIQRYSKLKQMMESKFKNHFRVCRCHFKIVYLSLLAKQITKKS